MIINRKSPSVFILENPRFQFYPGTNIIPEHLEKSIVENTHHKNLVDSKIHIIEVGIKKNSKSVDNNNESKNSDPIKELMNLSVNKAKKVISEMLNKPMLEEIKERDKRTGIQRLVNEQLAKIVITKDEMKEAG